MNKLLTFVFIILGISIPVKANPIENYLSSFSSFDGDNTFYSDDRLLRLDVDLDSDGQNETLLSLARHRNGKQGNIWKVYRNPETEVKGIGEIIFNGSKFYVGHISEINRYGLVSFWPSGAQEGGLYAHILNGTDFEVTRFSEIVRNNTTGELQGLDVLKKYISSSENLTDKNISSMNIKELADKYEIKVNPFTYEKVLRKSLIKNKLTQQPTFPSDSQNMEKESISPKTISQAKKQSLTVVAKNDNQPEPVFFPWLWISLILVILGLAVFFILRRQGGK